MFAAAFVTLLATPAARALALKANALAEVRDRDVHDKPTPRWGGLAMFLGVAIGIALASKLPPTALRLMRIDLRWECWRRLQFWFSSV